MNTMAVEIGDETYDLPYRWVICGNCDGEGKHSHAIDGHGITASEREMDWDDDSWDLYLRGGYDQICQQCKGSGKLKAPIIPDHLKEEMRRHQEALDAMYWEMEAERRMGC